MHHVFSIDVGFRSNKVNKIILTYVLVLTVGINNILKISCATDTTD